MQAITLDKAILVIHIIRYVQRSHPDLEKELLGHEVNKKSDEVLRDLGYEHTSQWLDASDYIEHGVRLVLASPSATAVLLGKRLHQLSERITSESLHAKRSI